MEAVVGSIRRDEPAVGLTAIEQRRPIVLDDPSAQATTPTLARLYTRHGYRTICFAPLIFREEPMGLLVLYHTTPYDWTDEELELAASFANQMATAVANARLYDSVSGLEARLRAIGELSAASIGSPRSTASARRSSPKPTGSSSTTPSASTGSTRRRMCEPIAFQGEFAGIGRPTLEQLRLPVGQGLTGWVAEHGRSLRIGDAASTRAASRSARRPARNRCSSSRCRSRTASWASSWCPSAGRNRFTEDDERTLTIFGGYAAQAMSNAGAFARLETQQAELVTDSRASAASSRSTSTCSRPSIPPTSSRRSPTRC